MKIISFEIYYQKKLCLSYSHIDAIDKIIEIAEKNEKTTIIAIGAITNVALAIKLAPQIISKIKVVWLGGHSPILKDNQEFNFRQDIQAVQEVFNSGVELVVIPCKGVSSHLSISIYELEHYLNENTKPNQFLKTVYLNFMQSQITTPEGKIGFSKVIWDLAPIAYEINPDWFKTKCINCPKVLDNGVYEQTTNQHKITFASYLSRDKIFHDFFMKLGEPNE
ncbi:MAG: nucleoside hydrolase [Firmicutes bacterium]|nr:nucleoside hydrolase [Bacillota bacterium]